MFCLVNICVHFKEHWTNSYETYQRENSHTENIIGGLPSHLKGSKETKEAIKELEKDKWIIPKIKTKEIHYSLNANKIVYFGCLHQILIKLV